MQKLASKFIEVMQECRHIAKNGTNTFHKYKYATSADVLEKVNAALVKHGIASTALPEIISITDVQTAKGSIEHQPVDNKRIDHMTQVLHSCLLQCNLPNLK